MTESIPLISVRFKEALTLTGVDSLVAIGPTTMDSRQRPVHAFLITLLGGRCVCVRSAESQVWTPEANVKQFVPKLLPSAELSMSFGLEEPKKSKVQKHA